MGILGPSKTILGSTGIFFGKVREDFTAKIFRPLDTQYSDFEHEAFMVALLNRIFLSIQLLQGNTQKVKWGSNNSVGLHSHHILNLQVPQYYAQVRSPYLCGHMMTPLRVLI